MNVHSFRSQFLEAAGQHDYQTVQQLLDRARPALATSSPSLKQWHDYALAYLALMVQQRPGEAIVWLESLYLQLDQLTEELQGRVLNALGIAYEMNEQWDKALQLFQACLDFYRVQDNLLRQGITLANMANVYCKGMSYRDAIACARQSIRFLEHNQIDREWQVNLGNAWNVLGIAQTEEGLWAEAETSLKTCLNLWQQWNDAWGSGIVHHNLGRVYQQQNRYESAIIHYSVAHDHLMATGDLRQASNTISRLGQTKLQAGVDIAEAQELLNEALRLAHLTHNHENITYIHLRRAELQEYLGNAAAALAETKQAVQTVEDLRANIMLTETRIRLQGSRIEAYEKMVARLHRDETNVASAFYYVEMCKSRVLIEMLSSRSAQARRPDHIPVQWVEANRTLRQRLYDLYQDDAADQVLIARLETELNQLRTRMHWQDAEYESFQTVKPLSLQNVQERLPEGGLLLEYFTSGDEILLFAVTNSSAKVLTLALRVSALARAFKQTGHDRLSTLHHVVRPVGGHQHTPWILQRLYQELIEPIAGLITPAKVLYIVPHGLLHYIPFHALYDAQLGVPRYLFETASGVRPIIYAPSATTQFEYCQHKLPTQQEGCLALGYNSQSLTLAEAEAQAVVGFIGGDSYVGKKATYAVLQQASTHYRFVHISCHGWFNPTWPMASSLMLADRTVDIFDILRELRLNADLVCLSACDTGQSHVMRGDELVGLSRAFLYAGTPSLVVSRWVVDELSTCLFMKKFYQELSELPAASGHSNALALAKAQQYIKDLNVATLRLHLFTQSGDDRVVQSQLQYLAHAVGLDTMNLQDDVCLLAHPYYWASFFLVGDRL